MEQCLNVTTVNQSRMCPTYWRTDGGNVAVFCLNSINKGEKIQPKFYHAVCLCKLSVHSSDFPFQTNTHTRQQLLADGMEGCIDTC